MCQIKGGEEVLLYQLSMVHTVYVFTVGSVIPGPAGLTGESTRKENILQLTAYLYCLYRVTSDGYLVHK